jgi:uncharacterized protein YeaO (DUF488 family)
MEIRIKRIHTPADPSDGHRILVDRLWPRGISKEKAAIDEWGKELAPSTNLRKFFHQSPDNWDVFKAEYEAELAAHPDELDKVRFKANRGPVTLVYAASDNEHNHAVILRDMLLRS